MSLTAALDAVLFQLIRLESPLVRDLQPGLSREAIDELVRPYSIPLPDDLYQLYQWRNGMREGSEAHSLWPHPAGYFAPLEMALSASAYLSEYLMTEEGTYTWEPLEFEPSAFYFDLFSDPGDSDFLVPCGPPPRDKPPIVFWSPVEGTPRVHYQDLESLMWTIAACYERGIYTLRNAFENEPLFVEADPVREREVTQQFNPSVTYWQTVTRRQLKDW